MPVDWEKALKEFAIEREAMAARKKQRAVEQFFEMARAEFLETNNPILVFQMWNYCRKEGYPIPDWVIAHIDQQAPLMACSVESSNKRLDNVLAQGMGFMSYKDACNRIKAYRNAIEAGDMMEHYINSRLNRHSETAAIDAAAEKFKMSQGTARTRLRTHVRFEAKRDITLRDYEAAFIRFYYPSAAALEITALSDLP